MNFLLDISDKQETASNKNTVFILFGSHRKCERGIAVTKIADAFNTVERRLC